MLRRTFAVLMTLGLIFFVPLTHSSASASYASIILKQYQGEWWSESPDPYYRFFIEPSRNNDNLITINFGRQTPMVGDLYFIGEIMPTSVSSAVFQYEPAYGEGEFSDGRIEFKDGTITITFSEFWKNNETIIVVSKTRKTIDSSLPVKIKPDYPAVIVDGVDLTFDVPPIIENGRTLVPLRAIFEAMGADVDWKASTQTVIATRGNTVVRLTIGDKTAYVGSKAVILDVPGKIKNGRTLVPLRFIGESFGAEVDWDGTTKTVTITSKRL